MQITRELLALSSKGHAPDSRSVREDSGELEVAFPRLVEDLCNEGADEISLDGFVPTTVRVLDNGLVSLAGCVIVTDTQALRPVSAQLAPWPAESRVYVGDKSDERPWSVGAERVPVPGEWAHSFVLRLPARLSAEELASWWRTGLRELMQILYWTWDPIGVRDAFPQSAGEYADVASSILGMLHAGSERRHIAGELRRVEVELLGEPRHDRASLDALARRLIDWYETSTSCALEDAQGTAPGAQDPRGADGVLAPEDAAEIAALARSLAAGDPDALRALREYRERLERELFGDPVDVHARAANADPRMGSLLDAFQALRLADPTDPEIAIQQAALFDRLSRDREAVFAHLEAARLLEAARTPSDSPGDGEAEGDPAAHHRQRAGRSMAELPLALAMLIRQIDANRDPVLQRMLTFRLARLGNDSASWTDLHASSYSERFDVVSWLDGGIMLKTRDPYGDPVELSAGEARAIASDLLRLAELDDGEAEIE